MRKTLLAALLLTASLHANAAMIDFETSGTNILDELPHPWTYQGFKFTNDFYHYSASADYRKYFPGGAANGTRHYMSGFSDTGIERADGQLFSISSLDLALSDYANPAGDFVTITGYFGAGGSLSQTVNLGASFAFQAVNLTGFTGLSSLKVSLPQDSGYLAFDNINYSLAGNVPEPANWVLLISGFGLAGFAARRRGQRVRVTFA